MSVINSIGEIQNINLQEILADEQWNCRGKIVPADVLDLIRDIEKHSLQNPIIVMPYNNELKPEYKYRLVAGYRRKMAFFVLSRDNSKYTKIPAIVKSDLDELGARRINLQENLIRKQLNIMQEAKAIEPFIKAGYTEVEIASEFQQSRGWAQVRAILLKLEPEIQKEASAGLLTQENIRQLYSIKPDKRLEACKEIKKRKESGERRVILPKIKPKNIYKAKPATKEEIEDMIEYIGKIIGMGFHTRLLAWCAGNITEYAIIKDFEEYCNTEGYVFSRPMPKEEKDELANLVSTGV